jgi:hypothetical protein
MNIDFLKLLRALGLNRESRRKKAALLRLKRKRNAVEADPCTRRPDSEARRRQRKIRNKAEAASRRRNRGGLRWTRRIFRRALRHVLSAEPGRHGKPCG